jgi:hypothetical protein
MLRLTDTSLSQVQTSQRLGELMAQQVTATEHLAVQITMIATLHAEEHRLQIAKDASEDRRDDREEARISGLIEDISLARSAVRQLSTVSRYVAKSAAAQTSQDIGRVNIADSGYAAVGMSNVNQVLNVKQKVGDVSLGKRGTGFIGIHNQVDHNAALSGRWNQASKP